MNLSLRKRQRVNTNLNTCDKQFKMAIEKGKKAEGDLWEGIGNKFDERNGHETV